MRITEFFNIIYEKKMVKRKFYKLTKLKKYGKIFIEKREKKLFMINSLNSMLSLLRPMMIEYTNMTPEDDELLGSFLENLDEKINNKENQIMDFGFGNMFNGMFKPIARGACKMGMNGKVAVRTSTGYKTYDIKKHKLTNCDSFAFDIDGAFWVVPTFKVECGDIILVNGKPRCVIAVGDTIKVFSYEDSTIDEVVPEHHVFMGKTYCYGKIFSPFMNMEKSDNAMSNMMNMMMMSQMFNGGNQNNMGFNPMMFMMMNNGGSNPFAEMFEGAFNFGDDIDTDKDEKEE